MISSPLSRTPTVIKSKNENGKPPVEQSVEIGIDRRSRAAVAQILSLNLADAHVLYIKTRNFHWNLIGPRFQSLHVFFESQYKELEASIDEIAERIRQIGGVAPGSMTEFMKIARLRENRGQEYHGDAAIKILVDDHETVIRQLRKDIKSAEDPYNDVGTSDFLTDLIKVHEKAAWMLRSFIQE